MTTNSHKNRFVEELCETNKSTRSLRDSYRVHRQRTTELAIAQAEPLRAGSKPTQRICMLGAGNCHDLDLPALAQRFSEVHLVDIDRKAVADAIKRQPRATRAQFVPHAPLDLSGMLDKLERWARLELTESELVEHHRTTALRIAKELGRYDVVVSGSFITQMQLSVLQALGEQHRLFDALRHILTATHLHTLYELLEPGGRAVLITDVLSNQSYPALDEVPPDADMLRLLGQMISAEQMIYTARPGLFHMLHQQDPLLGRNSVLGPPIAAWLWQNGPGIRFLVYAMVLKRNG